MIDGLALEGGSDGRYLAPHVDGHGGGAVVFGGQLLAQMVMAAGRELDGKPLTSLHAVFARPGRFDLPISIDVDVLHAGRSAASASVTVHQGGAPCVSALALAMASQPDVGRHTAPMPPVAGPDEAAPLVTALRDLEVRVVGDVDLSDPTGGGPAAVELWVRAPDAPDDLLVAQALLAYATEPHFVGTALRPHEGVSQAHSYERFVPAVVSHGLQFHAPFRARQWLLLALSSPHHAAGRVVGRGDVFTEEGELVASCWQENLLRPVVG